MWVKQIQVVCFYPFLIPHIYYFMIPPFYMGGSVFCDHVIFSSSVVAGKNNKKYTISGKIPFCYLWGFEFISIVLQVLKDNYILVLVLYYPFYILNYNCISVQSNFVFSFACPSPHLYISKMEVMGGGIRISCCLLQEVCLYYLLHFYIILKCLVSGYPWSRRMIHSVYLIFVNKYNIICIHYIFLIL